MVKIMTAHKESNRIEEACVTLSDTDGGKGAFIKFNVI